MGNTTPMTTTLPKRLIPDRGYLSLLAIYSISCMLMLPCLVVCQRRYLQRQLGHEQLNDQSIEEEDSNSETEEEVNHSGDIETQLVEDENHQQIAYELPRTCVLIITK